MPENMPQDPFTSLAEAASQLHELYNAYVAAGFSPSQSMQLVCAIMTASITNGSTE